MNDDKLNNIFRNKLSGHECDVPESVWDNIETRLPAPLKLHSPFRLYAVAAAVAAVVVLSSIFVFQVDWRNNRALPPAQRHLVANFEKAISDTHPESSASLVLTEKPILAAAPARQLVAEAVASDDLKPVGCEPSKPLTVDEDDLMVTASEVPALKIDEKEPLFDELAMEAISQEIVKNRVPRNWLSVKANAMTAATTAPVQYVTRAGEARMTCRHNMPLAVTASFEKRFGRWGVGSGLTYTYQSADYEMSDNARKGSQTLHYLGIPLYVSFQVAQVKRFSFYASAGGEVDFNIAGVRHESSDSQAYPELKQESIRDKVPQFSVQAHIGAAFELFKQFDLYLEPTLGYYIPNHSTVNSIWQDRSWNVSLSLGLRKGF